MREMYLKEDGVFLSLVEETDVSVLREIQNSEFVRGFMSSSLPKTDEDVLNDIRSTKKSGSPYFLIQIFEKADYQIIGFVKLEIISSVIRAAEIHIGILEEYTGKGIRRKVIDMITKYAFNDLNIHSIRALIREKNIASMRAFESQGYQKVGTLPEWSYYDGDYHDCYIYDCIPKFR